MMEYIIHFCFFIFGFCIGSWITAAMIADKIKEHDKALNDTPKATRRIYVEEHQNNLFAYDNKTHTFLCSFTSYNDLCHKLLGIDANVEWTFNEESRLLVNKYKEKSNGANVTF